MQLQKPHRTRPHAKQFHTANREILSPQRAVEVAPRPHHRIRTRSFLPPTLRNPNHTEACDPHHALDLRCDIFGEPSDFTRASRHLTSPSGRAVQTHYSDGVSLKPTKGGSST